MKVLLQQHSGWEVCGEAATGEETLQKCIELKPDVLVKDWVMPGMDSIELTRQISKLSPNTAIVIFSFYDMPELIEAAKAAGVHRVATKNIASLIAAVDDVLRSSANRLVTSSVSVTQPNPRRPTQRTSRLSKLVTACAAPMEQSFGTLQSCMYCFDETMP